MLSSKHLWFAVGIETATSTNKAPNWTNVQNKLNAGYIEPASHSKNHTVTPYADYDVEIGDSKSDIINNLVFPPLFRKGSTDYLYTWIAPGGNINIDDENINDTDSIIAKNREERLKYAGEGAKAFIKGVMLDYGPYKDGTFENDWWKKGWEQAELAYIKRQNK
jgi:hypothetical protein